MNTGRDLGSMGATSRQARKWATTTASRSLTRAATTTRDTLELYKRSCDYQNALRSELYHLPPWVNPESIVHTSDFTQ